MRIAIIGSRKISNTLLPEFYPNRDIFYFDVSILDSLLPKITEEEITIISGGARGIDKVAEQYAKDKNLKTLILEPDWDNLGKVAGFVRNDDIIKLSDVILAIWDGTSNGTFDVIEKCLKKHKPIYLLKGTEEKIEEIRKRIGISGKVKGIPVEGIPNCFLLKYRKNNIEYVEI